MNRIKELREQKKITQVRLSIELEVSQETISAYEKGKYYPSAKSLIRLRKIFGVPIDYILGLSDHKYETQAFSDLSQDEAHLLQLYRHLDPNGRELIQAYIQGYIDASKTAENCIDDDPIR